MAKKNFSVFDFAVYGIKSTLDNFRLFFLTSLTFLASISVLGLISAIIARPLFKKLLTLIPIYKDQFAVCRGKATCKGVMETLFKDIYSLLTVHGVVVALGMLLIIIVLVGLMLGFIRIVLDLHDNKISSPKRLFSCFHLIPKALVANFIFLTLVGFGLVLFIIPGIYLLIRLRFFAYYLVDKNTGPIESLKKSFNATSELWWEIFTLQFIQNLLFTMTSFISIPIGCMMMVTAYKKLPNKK